MDMGFKRRRFMKSISMVDHGRSRLNWVWRCRKGFASVLNPAIHIFAGEKVCIQRIRPMQFSVLLARRQRSRICSGVVRTGLKTMRTGITVSPSRELAIFCE